MCGCCVYCGQQLCGSFSPTNYVAKTSVSHRKCCVPFPCPPSTPTHKAQPNPPEFSHKLTTVCLMAAYAHMRFLLPFTSSPRAVTSIGSCPSCTLSVTVVSPTSVASSWGPVVCSSGQKGGKQSHMVPAASSQGFEYCSLDSLGFEGCSPWCPVNAEVETRWEDPSTHVIPCL